MQERWDRSNRKVLETAINELRKAGRDASPQKMRAAVDKVVLVFLRAIDRGNQLSK